MTFKCCSCIQSGDQAPRFNRMLQFEREEDEREKERERDDENSGAYN